MIKRLSILSVIFTLCAACLQAAASQPVRFKHLSVDEGLSQNTVLAIAEDGNRCIWAGTSDGLNRYDGYSFRVYRHIDGDTTSIENNFISSLLALHDGRLWIGTTSGLSLYDPHTDSFSNYSLPGRNVQVYAIERLSDGRLLLATDAGVTGFDPDTRRFDPGFLLAGTEAYCFCRFGEEVLIGTSAGVYAYSERYKTAARILPEIEKRYVTNIIATPGGECWIATHGGGLWRTDAARNVTARYDRSHSPERGLSNNIRVLRLDGKGRLWVGTTAGVFVYDPAADRFTSFMHSYEDPYSISHNSIRSIFMDSQGGVWLGTYYGGLNYYHPLAFRFNLMQHESTRNSLADNKINCISEDAATGNLWIGTNDSGLNYYEASTGHFTLYAAGEGGLRTNNIKTVLADGPGTLWIGTHAGGLSRLDRASGRITTYILNEQTHLRNSCYSILEQDPDTFWIGTLGGLFSFDKRTGRVIPNPVAAKHPRLVSSIINTLQRDSRGRIWIGTNYGLYLYTPHNGRLAAFESIGDNAEGGAGQQPLHAMCVAEDYGGRIWIGSKRGLLRYDEQTASLTVYTTADGLPNDCIYSILEDRYHRLWLSTNKGLSCFDTQAGTFRNYTRGDGLSSNQFNLYAACRTSQGAFYFGGINGITWFRPEQMTDNPFAPAPRITALTVFNREAVPGEGIRILRDSLGNIRLARLPARDNLFGVDFVVTNPLAGSNNTFAYMLEGFDRTWYQTRNTSVSYSNLSPGHYTLHVRACNNDGKWSGQTTSLPIRITPQWYQTLLARILYVLCALAVAAAVIRFFSARGKMRVQLYLERMEKRKIEELSQEKIRFYINMSHELRTPLTLILSPLQEIMAHDVQDKFVRERIDYVYGNSQRLLHMVNQLLSYRKAELGMFRISVRETDPEAVVADIFSMFEENAHHRDMNYMLNSTLGGARAAIDPSYVEMMVTNLLSNAFKFTPDGGTIRVGLDMEGDRLVISVRDSGIGIPADKLARIFERFYQVDEGEPGTGIGLAIVKLLAELHHGSISIDTEPGRFTEFRISLPASIASYAPQELASAQQPAAGTVSDVSLFLQDAAFAGEQRVQAPHQGPHDESILIVEDNRQIKQYLADSFADRFNIFTASDGNEALQMLKTTEPDIVITDVMMPGMDGLKLTRAIKQNIRTSHIMVIILTAKDSMEDQMAGIGAGADDYLAKPFSLPILQAKINNLLKTRHRLRHHYSRSMDVDPDKITSNAMDGEFLKKAIKIVEDNLGNEEFSSDDFARELCISRSNLHLKMKSITGESSTQFIRKIRFNRACQLLTEGKYSIAEISSIVGFSSPSYFATSFKKHVGCLPTEYQKNRGASREESGPKEE